MRRLVAIFLVLAAAAFAQTNRGSIAGTVTDHPAPSSPGHSQSDQHRNQPGSHRDTASNGEFSVADLEPVEYRLEITAQGFKKEVIDKVKVDTASIATVKRAARDRIGGYQGHGGGIGGHDRYLIGHLEQHGHAAADRRAPLLNRSVLDLALTLPNVGGDAGSEDPVITSVTPCPGCNLTLGGGRPMSSMIMADGTNNTGVSLGRTIVSFSPETVQEFTVQTSAFSAEYGTTGGGIINATTKSGTNELHGTALWYNRNPDFAAAPFTLATTNRPQPTLKYNQFSLAAGGPVYIPKIYNGKNKTFWFAAVEPQYRRDHLDQYGLLPTPGMCNGDFSGLVNTNSGWLPQSVVNQFQSHRAQRRGRQWATATSTTSTTWSTAINSSRLLCLPETTYAPVPRQRDSARACWMRRR